MSVLEDQVKLKIQSAINKYFEMKKDEKGNLKFQFTKKCSFAIQKKNVF